MPHLGVLLFRAIQIAQISGSRGVQAKRRAGSVLGGFESLHPEMLRGNIVCATGNFSSFINPLPL
jgi:hypothetical protein